MSVSFLCSQITAWPHIIHFFIFYPFPQECQLHEGKGFVGFAHYCVLNIWRILETQLVFMSEHMNFSSLWLLKSSLPLNYLLCGFIFFSIMSFGFIVKQCSQYFHWFMATFLLTLLHLPFSLSLCFPWIFLHWSWFIKILLLLLPLIFGGKRGIFPGLVICRKFLLGHVLVVSQTNRNPSWFSAQHFMKEDCVHVFIWKGAERKEGRMSCVSLFPELWLVGALRNQNPSLLACLSGKTPSYKHVNLCVAHLALPSLLFPGAKWHTGNFLLTFLVFQTRSWWFCLSEYATCLRGLYSASLTWDLKLWMFSLGIS